MTSGVQLNWNDLSFFWSCIIVSVDNKRFNLTAIDAVLYGAIETDRSRNGDASLTRQFEGWKFLHVIISVSLFTLDEIVWITVIRHSSGFKSQSIIRAVTRSFGNQSFNCFFFAVQLKRNLFSLHTAVSNLTFCKVLLGSYRLGLSLS